MTTFAIGIPTYNRFDRLEECLKSILSTTPGSAQAIRVLNNSEQSINGLVKFCDPSGLVTVIDFDDQSLSAMWNRLTRAGSEEVMILLNDDVIVYHHWLEATVRAVMSGVWVGPVGYDLLGQAHDGAVSPGRLRVRFAESGFYPPGCAFAFRRSVFNELGGFDESFPLGHEEADFGMRACMRGFVPYTICGIDDGGNERKFVYHYGSQTSRDSRGSREADSRRRFEEKYGLPLGPDLNEKYKNVLANRSRQMPDIFVG